MEKMSGDGLQECHRRFPPFLVQNECDSLLFDYQSDVMKDDFMITAKIVKNDDVLVF